jgi:integrase/recombinase XerD
MEKLPEIITEEQLQQIIDAEKNNKRKLAYALGFYECLRISEVCCLLPEHVQLNTKLLLIKGSDITKGLKGAKRGKDRNIPIAPEIIKGLKYLPVGSLKAKDSGINALQKAFKKKCLEVLNRTDIHFHTLRHSGITHYLTKKKWGSLEVQRLAGHSNIAITEIYTHINPTHLVERMWGESKE